MTSPLRVLHLITGLNTGGAEMALFRLLAAMDREKFEAQVVCLIPIGPVGEKIRALGIQVISLEMTPGHPALRGFRQLLGILRAYKPDILQTWLYHADLLGLLAAKLTGTRTVIWNIRLAEVEFLQARRFSSLVVGLCASLSNWPTVVIINSRAGQTLHTQLGYHPKDWIYIPNGIDTTLFQPDPQARQQLRLEWGLSADELLVGLVGRLDPQKDHPTFLRTAALTQKQAAKVRFVCVGTGPDNYQQKLKNLAARLNLSNLLWAGSRTDMAAVYNGLDVLISASVSEGFPNVVAEAMACEKPCVVTTVGDSAALVGETGLSTPPGDPETLAECLLRMLELPETERTRLGRQARQRIVENFGLGKMVSEYTALYTRLGRSRKNPASD